MTIALLDFIQNVLRIKIQVVGTQSGRPPPAGLPRDAHIVVHCIRMEEGHTFTELVDRFGLVPVVCELLGLSPDVLPDPTTLYDSIHGSVMYVWRAWLASAQQLHGYGHVALDSTFFE